METKQLQEKCTKVRRDIIELVSSAASGHPGGSLSTTELMVATFNTAMRINPEKPKDPSRDRFVLSKGHCAPAYYAVLCDLGFFSRDEYKGFRQLHGILQGHPDAKKVPGIDASTGSLGQGISIAVGMALGAKKMGTDVRVFTILGDGELQEGLVWEAAMAAAHYKLDNLTVMVDNNGLQIDGSNKDVMDLGNIGVKFAAFGFDVIEVEDGNDIEQVVAALAAKTAVGMPKCIVAHTIKGCGVSFMENNAGWHGKAPNAEQTAQALAELEA